MKFISLYFPDKMTKKDDSNDSVLNNVSSPATARYGNSSEEITQLLQALNHERALYNIPAMIWVSLLMVVGVVGNSLVVYVYRRRFKKTSSNYFILSMAIFDLIACLVGMPTEIYDLNNPYTFYSSAGCKILRGCEVFTVYGSATVLVEIAFDRYFKICRPLMVVSLSRIRMLCLLAVILALLLSIPPFVLFGINRVKTSLPMVEGYDCSIAMHYKDSVFQTVHYIILGVLILLTFISLTAIYIRIWMEIRCRRHLFIGDHIKKECDSDSRPRLRIKYVPSVSEDESMNNSVYANGNNMSMTQLQMNNSKKSSSSQNTLNSLERRSKFSSLASYASRLKVTRTTIVLFAVTVAFVLSYLPSIAVMLIRSTVKDFDENQSIGAQVVAKIFSNCFFINHAINPIIYSFLNIHFRQQVQKTFQRIFCCFCYKRKSPQKMDSDRSTKKEFLTRD
ncbi:unnamed protein product [Candidula unifasciata]|uniref:G-protein coupled receptors family 1 profile domain-containing protein n=1 Tax=Candidula unifasciata TaxID=100452 RepID=A0A8S3YMI1_9EUPU|nr:unnamed protein product [Candidula unifasciata]